MRGLIGSLLILLSFSLQAEENRFTGEELEMVKKLALELFVKNKCSPPIPPSFIQNVSPFSIQNNTQGSYSDVDFCSYWAFENAKSFVRMRRHYGSENKTAER